MGTRKKISRHPLQGFFILKQKQEEAIKFIQEHCPPEGYFLGFSGGKDSEVVHHLATLSNIKFKAFYSSTGIDPPQLVSFIKKNYPNVKFLRPKRSFYEDIIRKGFPSKHGRWCCDTLKKNPAKKIPLVHRLLGIRREESAKRATRGKISKFGRQTHYHPIYDWNEYEVWEYISRYKLPYCKLYDDGFNRIGCMICPFICRENQNAVNKAKAKFPKAYKAFERAMEELYENKEWYRQKTQGKAMLFEEFLENWYRGVSGKGYTWTARYPTTAWDASNMTTASASNPGRKPTGFRSFP